MVNKTVESAMKVILLTEKLLDHCNCQFFTSHALSFYESGSTIPLIAPFKQSEAIKEGDSVNKTDESARNMSMLTEHKSD